MKKFTPTIYERNFALDVLEELMAVEIKAGFKDDGKTALSGLVIAYNVLKAAKTVDD